MPELPRISGSEAVRVFGLLGFRQVRQRGSHVVLRRGDKGCTVPLHSSLAIGTLRGALRQANVEPDEFVEAYDVKCVALEEGENAQRSTLNVQRSSGQQTRRPHHWR